MADMPAGEPSNRQSGRASGAMFLAAAFAGTFGVMVLTARLVSIRESTTPERSAAAVPSLFISSIDRLSRDDSTRDRLELLDPSPLFMPGTDAVPGAASADLRDRPGGRVAELFPAAMVFNESAAGRELLVPAVPGSAVEALGVVTQRRFFDGLARQDRSGATEVSSYPTGRVEFYREGATAPESEFELGVLNGVASTSWRPVEFRLLVNASGLAAQLVMVSGSGVDELDSAVRTRLKNDLLLRAKLKPGNYRILAGP